MAPKNETDGKPQKMESSGLFFQICGLLAFNLFDYVGRILTRFKCGFSADNGGYFAVMGTSLKFLFIILFYAKILKRDFSFIFFKNQRFFKFFISKTYLAT